MLEPSKSYIGQQVGNYRLIRLLGQGGFADVYLGEHIFLKTQAAIKLLSLRLDSDNMDSFLNEAQTIAKLRHPHIVHVFECGIEHSIPFLVMDYIPNGTLRQRYPRGSRLLPEQIVLYIQQIASALSYAHQQRLIHRDIKPENMLLGHNGEVMLSDFGLALTAQSSGSQTAKEMAGTVPYMAPEQLEGRPRIASDQYDHSLLPFQTYTMGIYATDPYGFSELQSCQYPDTATCSWIIAYSSSENTDYTKGKHTFIAFLGNIGGSILANSNSVTITWS